MAWLVMIFLFGLASGVASSPASSTDATCKTCQKIIGEADAVDTAALLQSRTHVEEKTAIQKAAALRDEAPVCDEIVAYQDTQGNPWSKLPPGSSYQDCQNACETQGDEWTLFTFWPGGNGCRCSTQDAPNTTSIKAVISGPLNCRKACEFGQPGCPSGQFCGADGVCKACESGVDADWTIIPRRYTGWTCNPGLAPSSTEFGCCEVCPSGESGYYCFNERGYTWGTGRTRDGYGAGCCQATDCRAITCGSNYGNKGQEITCNDDTCDEDLCCEECPEGTQWKEREAFCPIGYGGVDYKDEGCCEACPSGRSWKNRDGYGRLHYEKCGDYGTCCPDGYTSEEGSTAGVSKNEGSGCCTACTCDGRPQWGLGNCNDCAGCAYTDGECKACPDGTKAKAAYADCPSGYGGVSRNDAGCCQAR